MSQRCWEQVYLISFLLISKLAGGTLKGSKESKRGCQYQMLGWLFPELIGCHSNPKRVPVNIKRNLCKHWTCLWVIAPLYINVTGFSFICMSMQITATPPHIGDGWAVVGKESTLKVKDMYWRWAPNTGTTSNPVLQDISTKSLPTWWNANDRRANCWRELTRITQLCGPSTIDQEGFYATCECMSRG